jgi:hypothetical protein
MGFLDMFKKKKEERKDMKYNGIEVKLQSDDKDSKENVSSDFTVLENKGIEKIIKKDFIKWLKGEDFLDKDDEEIFKGLKVYEITYRYGRIIEKYSPIKKEGYFGQFEFCFESSSEYTNEIFEAVAMQVYVYNGKVVKVSGYDI